MSKFVETSYGTRKEFLKFPDHYVALAVMVDDQGVAEVDGRKIVPRGTVVGGKGGSVLAATDVLVGEKFVPDGTVTPAVASTLVTGSDASNNKLTFTAKTAGVGGDSISIEFKDKRDGTVDASAVDNAGDAITFLLKNTTAKLAEGESGEEGSNNGLTYTSKLPGADGNDIIIVLQDPKADDQPLSVVVHGHTILVSLATGTGAITSDAADVLAKIEETPAATALVEVVHTGESTGVGLMEDETVVLADGSDGAIETLASEVASLIAGNQDVAALIEVTEGTTVTGALGAMPATNLSGGAAEIPGGDDSVDGAEGLLMNDVDVTHGPKEEAMLIHGFVEIGKLPYGTKNASVAELADIKLKGVHFIK